MNHATSPAKQRRNLQNQQRPKSARSRMASMTGCRINHHARVARRARYDYCGHMTPTSGPRTVAVADLKARLSEYLRMVKGGAEVTVTDRGRPVARLMPVSDQTDSANRMQELIASGAARAPRKKLTAELWRHPRASDPNGVALAAILEERREGR